jgi:hypothetical protein
MSVGGVRFCRLVLILMLVSIGLRGRIGVAGKNPFYLLSSIYSSFTKLWCENYGETQWEEEYPLPVSSTRRYFKMQSVHGPSVYRTVPSAQYKPHHTPVAQWYQYYCVITLAHFLLPVTVILRLPFTLLFLMSFLLAWHNGINTTVS